MGLATGQEPVGQRRVGEAPVFDREKLGCHQRAQDRSQAARVYPHSLGESFDVGRAFLEWREHIQLHAGQHGEWRGDRVTKAPKPLRIQIRLCACHGAPPNEPQASSGAS